jgi:hypothetical protein
MYKSKITLGNGAYGYISLVPLFLHPSGCRLPASLLEEKFWWCVLFGSPAHPELLGV